MESHLAKLLRRSRPHRRAVTSSSGNGTLEKRDTAKLVGKRQSPFSPEQMSQIQAENSREASARAAAQVSLLVCGSTAVADGLDRRRVLRPLEARILLRPSLLARPRRSEVHRPEFSQPRRRPLLPPPHPLWRAAVQLRLAAQSEPAARPAVPDPPPPLLSVT